MGKQGAELSGWDQSSSSSTVLLDPAALLETCKQRIQVKDGIPAGRQRLIFACRVANPEGLSYTCKKSSTCPGTEENAGCEFVTELRGWEAILKDDNRNIARLLHPVVELEEQVAAEDERKASQLSCQTARELRSMGIPCNVYYLYFSKWIPAPVKNGKCCQVTSSVEIQIDKEFHSKSFEILLFGRLNGSYLPMPFVYRMNGGEVASQVSMQEQMAQYRQGQKTRHRLGLSTQSVAKGVEGRDVHAAVEDDGLSNGYGKGSHVDDYYCPCGKDLDFNVLISGDHQFKCIRSFVLKVIQVPADAARKPDQSASQVPGRCERGVSNGQHDPNKYCVSSTGAISCKSESFVSEDKAALAEFLPTKCCQCAGKSSRPREGNESSGVCSLEVPSPSEISESAASDTGICLQNVSNSSIDDGTEGLPIVEEPVSQLLKKKKKKRKGKRSGKRTAESSSSPASINLDSTSALSTMNGSVDSCTQPAMVECQCLFRKTTGSEITGEGMDLSRDSPLMKDTVRELSTCGDKSEAGLVNIFRRKVHCFEDSKEYCGSSTIRAESKKIGQGYLTAEEIIAEIVSDKQTIASSKQSSKDSFGTNTVLKHGGEFLPGISIKSSTCLCTGSCDVLTDFRDSPFLSVNPDNAYMCSSTCPSNDVVVSQPFVGPIMVEMGFRNSAPPARSLGDSLGPHYPSRELFGNLEAVSDSRDLGFSDTHFSARGGYNGSGAGSRNGRSGADGSGNRSHGRGGSEDRKGASGYHGGGQGSSGSNHGSGPGGSSTSGSSGGSGGGNGNRGGGRGGSGGSWDGRRSDEDGGNVNKDGDNDERYRNSFQASSNGEAAPDAVPQKKGISSLDNRSSHGRKGFNGGGDLLMNGTSSGDKENVNCWHKQNPDEWTEDSRSASQPSAGSEEKNARTHADQKNGPPSMYMNGFVQPETKVSNLTEGRDGVDPYPHKRPTPSQGSFAKALKQNISDEDQMSTSSSRGSKESRNDGTLPGMGAWEKNSWDDQEPLYNRHVSEGTSQVGASKGKQYVKPTRNGVQMRGHSSDSDTINHIKSVAVLPTNGVQDKPSSPNGSQDNFSDSKMLSNSDSTRITDGRIYQSSVQSSTMASEQITQSRMSLVSNGSVRQHGEARSAPEDASLRLFKTRKTSGDQERLQVRDKVVGDRERTITHWPQQKWVPVDHKSGSSVKAAGPQSSSSGHARTGVPAENDITESSERPQGFVNTKEVSNRQEDTRRGDVHSSSSLAEVSHSTSPSKSLRRLQTFPSGNNNVLSRVSDSEVQAVEPKEPGATMASERPAVHLEQANIRGLLPRERIMDHSSTQIATQSTVGGHSASVQSPTAGEQKSKLRLDDRVGKGSTATVKPVLSPAEEDTRRAVREILNAVQSSCRDRWAAEQIVREVGCPMAEFEKVLAAVAPSFCFVLDPTIVMSEKERPCGSGRGAISSREHSIQSQTCKSEEFSLCRCGVSHIPLKSIWQWYEDPSYYGIEVNAVNSQRVQRNGVEEEPFLAYFVPYISALQIFGSSRDRDSRDMDDLSTSKGNIDAPLTSQPKEFSCSNMLATLFPTPGKSDESLSHGRPPCTASGPRYCNLGDEDCGIKLLYEFFDADQPQMRQPLYLKVKELVEGGSSSNFYSRGDPEVLDRLCLGDIHPASWFAVAWYPIYRIAEGPLKAVFLTYHSFDHFAPQSSLSCLTGGTIDVVDSISMPVVGLECYNLQGEPWLSMGGRFAKEATKVKERLTENPNLCLERRINSLQEVAAGMAKGIPDSKSATSGDGINLNKFRHSDYEFFVKRRTAVRQVYKFEH